MKTLTATFLFVLINFFAFATQEKKQVKIRITAPGGYFDETTVYFDLGVTPAYSASEDGPKVYSDIPNAPSIFSISSDNVFCSTNGYSRLTTSEIIPLGIKTDTSGMYIFTSPLLVNFDPTTIVQLEDRLQNIFTDLRVNFYPVQLADSQNIIDRFFLHVSRPIQFSSLTAGCNNNDGTLQLNQDNSVIWNSLSLYDSTGYLINSSANISGNYNFPNLSEGDYNLVMAHGYNSITEPLHVNGNYIVAHIIPSSLTASVNQEITFYTTAHNVTDYQWALGDVTETEINGIANPSYAYFQPGTYQVDLTCSNNAGCEYRDSISVTISSATGITGIKGTPRNISANAKTVTVVLNEEIKQGAELKIYNLLGQPVCNNPLTYFTTVITLSELPTGYYIVSLQNNQVVSTKRVFIGK